MLKKTRDKFVAAAVNKFMVALSCNKEIAETILSTLDGFKLQGVTKTEARGYSLQLLCKNSIEPTELAIEKLDDFMDVKSIMTDVPAEADKYCNPVFPFIGNPGYVSDPTQNQTGPRSESSLVKSKSNIGTIPKMKFDFFYVEANMPDRMFVMVNNTQVEQVLSSGVDENLIHPTFLWTTEELAQDAFRGNIDSLHAGATKNELKDGTLMAIATDYLHRDPAKFFPLQRKGRFVAMQYTDKIIGSAFKPIQFNSSKVHVRSVYDAKN